MLRVAARVDGVRAQEGVERPTAGKFTAWFFEEVEAAGAVNVVANGVFGVGDAVDVAMNTAGNRSSQTGRLYRSGLESSDAVIIFVANLPPWTMFAGMDWQQAVSLLIVAATAGVFLWTRFRRRQFRFERDTHCGCSSPSQSAPQRSIVFHARKGERPQIILKSQ